MTDISKAPWTDEQVKNLNTFQAYSSHGFFHPFTCPAHGDGKHSFVFGEYGMLEATPEGWKCPDCDYTQNWAHTFMTLPLPPEADLRVHFGWNFDLPATDQAEAETGSPA